MIYDLPEPWSVDACAPPSFPQLQSADAGYCKFSSMARDSRAPCVGEPGQSHERPALLGPPARVLAYTLAWKLCAIVQWYCRSRHVYDLTCFGANVFRRHLIQIHAVIADR